MNVLAWVMIILVLAMVVGPIMWLRPTPSQQRQSVLRQKAQALGLRVELQAPPRTKATEVGGWVAYRAAPLNNLNNRESWYLSRSAYEHGLNFSGNWRWHTDKPPKNIPEGLESFLEGLPGEVQCFGWDRGGAVVYWRESKDIVDELAIILKQFRQKMSGD